MGYPAAMRAACLFLLCLVTLTVPSVGADEAPFTALGGDKNALVTGVGVLADAQGSLALADVTTRSFTPQATFGPTGASAVYWLRIPLANPALRPVEALVVLGGWDRVTLWQPDGTGWIERRGGVLVPLKERSSHFALQGQVTRVMLPVSLPPASRQVLFARVESVHAYQASPGLGARLRDAEDVRMIDRNNRVYQGAFLGLVLALALYNLVLLFAMRDLSYFYYVLGIVGFGMIWAGNYQLSFEYLWPDHPAFSKYAFSVSAAAATVGTIFFSRLYLDTARWMPRIDKLLFVLPLAVAGLLLVSPILPVAFVSNVLDQLAGPVYLISLAIAVWALWVRHPLRGYFFAAHASLSIGNILWIVQVWFWRELSLPPPASMPWQFGQIGMALEGILLSLGLADRIKRLDREKRELVELQRSELEMTVTKRTAELESERARSELLLTNILPAAIAEELKRDGKAAARRHEEVTILFTDFAGFTQTMSTVPAQRLVQDLDDIFSAFDEIVARHGLEKIKTIGDAYMAAAGLPEALPDHACRAVSAALDMIDWINSRNESASIKWHLRVGLHSGPVVAGVVGRHKYAYDVWGDTVNIASRMESSGDPGRVNVSAYTWDLVRDQFDGDYRGRQSAKGKGEMDMYFITGPKGNAGLEAAV